jgi:hypothetical protein
LYKYGSGFKKLNTRHHNHKNTQHYTILLENRYFCELLSHATDHDFKKNTDSLPCTVYRKMDLEDLDPEFLSLVKHG